MPPSLEREVCKSMQDIIAYLFNTLSGIAITVEFATFMAALGLVAVASLIVWTVSRRH